MLYIRRRLPYFLLIDAPGLYYRPGVYLRPSASIRGNTVNMLNILRWDGLCESVNCFYSYYHSVGVTASSVGVAPVVKTSVVVMPWSSIQNGGLWRIISGFDFDHKSYNAPTHWMSAKLDKAFISDGTCQMWYSSQMVLMIHCISYLKISDRIFRDLPEECLHRPLPLLPFAQWCHSMVGKVELWWHVSRSSGHRQGHRSKKAKSRICEPNYIHTFAGSLPLIKRQSCFIVSKAHDIPLRVIPQRWQCITFS